MALTLVAVLFLVAAIIFLLDALLAMAAPHWIFTSRMHALAFGLMAIALLLWYAGR
jgi:hypothetical protein